MLDALLEKITDAWIRSGTIPEEDRDIYIYGLDLLLSTAITLITLGIAAVFLHRLPETLLLWAVILPLQACGGGYHAKTHFRCFIVMLGCWALSVFILMPLMPVWAASAGTLAGLTAVWTLAPVRHENVPASPERRALMRRICRGLAAALALLCNIGLWLVPAMELLCLRLSAGLLVTAVSMLSAWVRYRAVCARGQA